MADYLTAVIIVILMKIDVAIWLSCCQSGECSSRSYGNVSANCAAGHMVMSGGTLTTGTGMFQPAKWASPYSDLANRRQLTAYCYIPLFPGFWNVYMILYFGEQEAAHGQTDHHHSHLWERFTGSHHRKLLPRTIFGRKSQICPLPVCLSDFVNPTWSIAPPPCIICVSRQCVFCKTQ